MKKLELLSPAKNAEVARVAIDNGADAVYIGGPAFGARAAVGNSMDDIAAVVRYAHRFYCRVFLTLNTVLFDNELPQAERIAREAYRLGVDALIVQDAGLLRLDLPPIALHASTQMHNYDLDRVRFLDRLGFQRIVLARELSLDQLRAIRRETRAELEYFVHGALCVSLSGQCYLSRHLSGRSANRGECMQACRLRWDVEDASGRALVRDKHVLSLKDLNLSAHLAELADAGIDSFKIEGRLKDADYVANVTRYYSRRLDTLVANAPDRYGRVGEGQVKTTLDPDLDRTFNRGYTTYFLHGRPPHLVNMDTPKSMGKRVAVVLSARGNRLTVRGTEPIHNGDGLCYLDGPDLRGIRVNRADGNHLFCAERVNPRPGTVLYRNHDHEFLARLSREKAVREIPLTLTARADDGHLLLTATDPGGLTVTLRSPDAYPLADNPAQRQRLLEQLAKCGGTGYRCLRADYLGSTLLFLPLSAVNALRRRLLDDLTLAREAHRPRWQQPPLDPSAPDPLPADWRLNITNRLAADFYRAHGVHDPEPGFEKSAPAPGRALMTTRYCLLHELGLCRRQPHPPALRLPLYLSNPLGRFLLDFDCRHCFMTVKSL